MKIHFPSLPHWSTVRPGVYSPFARVVSVNRQVVRGALGSIRALCLFSELSEL